MDLYNYQNLTEIIGARVQVIDQQGNQVELTVSEVNKSQLDGDEWEAFSVIYLGEQNISISQGTYSFSHQCFGEARLFLCPNSAIEYETVVTRQKNEVKNST